MRHLIKMDSLHYLVLVFCLTTLSVVKAVLDHSDYGPKMQALVEPLHSSCITQSGADESSINNVGNGIFVDEPRIKVYMTCLLLNSKVINEEGTFNYETVYEKAPPKFRQETVRNVKICATKVNDISNLDDRIFAFFDCFYHIDPDLFFFF